MCWSALWFQWGASKETRLHTVETAMTPSFAAQSLISKRQWCKGNDDLREALVVYDKVALHDPRFVKWQYQRAR